MVLTRQQVIPGLTGKYINDLELDISGNELKKLRHALTIKNGSIAWRVNFLKKKIKYWDSIAETPIEQFVLVPSESPLYEKQFAVAEKKIEKAKEKSQALKEEMEELLPLVTQILYDDNPDGSITVPPGLWYECSSVTDDYHLNYDLKPYYLETDTVKLRQYQTEALDELYKYKRAMVELATGLGKSKIIQSIALAAVKSNKRVMIVVPSEYLVGQMCEELKAIHPNTTAQGGGREATLGWDILVTTQQSAGNFADRPQVVIFDEAHHSPAETWTKLAMSLSAATHVYGFTATAFRADGLDTLIHAFCGPVVYSRDVRWGIENGYLSPLLAFSIIVNPKKNNRKINLSDTIPATTAYKILAPSYEAMVVARDKLIAGTAKGRKAIVVFKTVEACKVFRKFCSTDIDMDVASAQQGRKSKAPMKRFKNGESNILLINSGLIAEGVDLPDADLLIQLCQNSSDVMTLQMLGRILRKPLGKINAILIDITTNGYKQFERSGQRRRTLYSNIVGTENLKTIVVE
jgi:superfamily II DNA or RNA helicase